jgi:transcriptional regulator with GAF, ATPase, and Fis domain
MCPSCNKWSQRYYDLAAQISAGNPPEYTKSLTAVPLQQYRSAVIDHYQRQYLLEVLARTNGSIGKACIIAGLDRTNFRRLLKRLGLHENPAWQNQESTQ